MGQEITISSQNFTFNVYCFHFSSTKKLFGFSYFKILIKIKNDEHFTYLPMLDEEFREDDLFLHCFD